MNNNKTIIIIAVSIVAVFGLLYGVYALTNTPVDYSQVTKVREGDHVEWSAEKKHVLVEYSDLQCPACRVFNELLRSYESSKSAHADIPKKVTLVYRHFPLYQIHQDAFPLAYAVEAAGRQGKFFQMLNAVFDGQPQLEGGAEVNAFIQEKAKAVGLDVAQLKKDQNAQEVKSKVESDLADGQKLGIDSTPTFFLDGHKLEFQTVDQFVAILSGLK